MSLIKDAIDAIAKLTKDTVKRVEIINLVDGTYKIDQESGALERVIETPRTRANKLGDIASLRAWCATEPGGDVTIGRYGATRAHTPAKALEHERSKAQVDFFDAFIPKQAMGLRALIAWLDLIRPGLTPKDADAIDNCMKAVTVTDGSSATVTQTGAAITVRAETGKGLSTERPFPKRFTATIPFGDPSFVTAVTFSATLESRGSELVATMAVDELELAADGTATGPRARFVAWARDQLAGLDGWTVMVGA